MGNSSIYVGIDIGTTSIKVIIAEYLKDQINIIGYGNTRSAGLNRGVIVDIDQVVKAIKEAVKQAEEKANIQISEVSVGVPANMLQIERCKGMIAIGNEDGNSKEISDIDVRRVTEAALVQNLPPERDVIDIVTDEFIVDGFDGIKDPRGMVGVRLEMQGVMYTGPKTILHNTRKCIERAGLKVKDMIVAPLALSQVALTGGEKDFGAILIDLGGGQTTAAVIHDHQLKYTYVDQEGGDYVTRDISIVLNTSIENAEILKRNYGYADETLASSEDTFPVTVVGQQEPEMITEEYLAQIIEARLQQIFGKLKADLDRINALQLPGGIVLTGGLAALPGVKELAQKVFGVNVKVFIPQEMNLRFPSFAQVIGIVEYVTQENEIDQIIRRTLDGQEFISKPKVNQIDEDEQQDVETDFDPVADGYDTPRDKKKEDKPKRMDRFKAIFDKFFD